MEQETTFYEELQKSINLDLRDNRGKIHDLPYVLLGFTISLLRRRDGFLSSIHRSIKHKNTIGIDDLLFSYYNMRLSESEKCWFAVDGKSLKGSIPKGKKQGDALVQIVEHEALRTVGQSMYTGHKDCERICARNLLEKSGFNHKKLTLDALLPIAIGMCPNTTEPIVKAGGNYLISLKDNQSILLGQMSLHSELEEVQYSMETKEKGHGRIEKRHYKAYDLKTCSDKIELAPRWSTSDISMMIQVKRDVVIQKTGKKYIENSFYLTNSLIQNAEECCKAIRNHWGVEVNNHIRDVTLKEDVFRTKFTPISKITSSIRTLVINLLLLDRPKNLAAQLEAFQDDFDVLILWLKRINFL